MTRHITLLTDFGTQDGYVGAMKGVLLVGAPEAILEDIAHSIPRGDVLKASQVLGRYWSRFPPGTVHLVVVDPGVGTDRRGLALAADGHFFVGPDNGVFTQVLSRAETWRCVELAPSPHLPEPGSHTFHGRDLFAPAAAFLATGTPLESLGSSVEDPRELPTVGWREEREWAVGQIVEVDRFGNLATNLPLARVRTAGGVELAGRWIPLLETYGDAESGSLLTLVDSEGRVEVAVRDGSAAEALQVESGAPVRVPLGDPSP